MMRSSPLIAVVIVLALAACRDYELQSTLASPGAPYITGVIASRRPGEMYVVQNPTFYCDSTAHIGLLLLSRVVGFGGAVADTSALTVGRRVSVWLSPGVAVDVSCPPQAAAGVIVLEN